MGAPLTFYHYNAAECIYSDNITLQECAGKDSSEHVNWLNVLGISNPAVLQEVADLFSIHPLALEDIASPRQRAKFDEYDDMLYVVLRMFYLRDKEIIDQQLSVVLRDNILITFREADAGIFRKAIGEKLIAGTGQLRKKGEDYLLYTILDTVIDNYQNVLEYLGDEIETLDSQILREPKNSHLVLLQHLKGNVLYLRKNLLPVRDLITNLIRQDVGYFEPENAAYLRDLQDHIQRAVEEIDFQRDQLNSLMDLYYSLQAHKMNNVMKTLTGVSFVLLPLTFLASLYGMNFVHIPHANSPNGFYEMVAAMAAIALVLTIFAFRRNWLSTQDFNKRRH